VSASKAGCVVDGTIQIFPGPFDGGAHVELEREVRGDGGRQRAAGAVEAGGRDPRASELEAPIRTTRDIDRVRPLHVTPFDKNDAGAERTDPAGGVVHVIDRADADAAQGFGFRDVWRDHLHSWQELRAERLDGARLPSLS
jgi:hypothetical protein